MLPSMRFILVSDPKQPDIKPWWVLLMPKGDYVTLMQMHKWHANALFIKDGQNPHVLRDRERGDMLAELHEPITLGARWLITATKLTGQGDTYIGVNGGMCPRDGKWVELQEVEANSWPAREHNHLRAKVTLSTWGNHWYATSPDMTFLTKYDTEQQAMDAALQFATPDNITVKRETHSFVAGD